MKVTQEALEAGAKAAQKMGFAITPFMVAPIAEAMFSQMFPDVEVDAEDYRLRKVESAIEAMAASVNSIATYIQANDALIQSLKDGSFIEENTPHIVHDFVGELVDGWHSDLV